MGAAEKALEITTEYAKERKQFGKPLAAFQSISHYLADATTRIDGGRTLVYKAASVRDAGRDAERRRPCLDALSLDRNFRSMANHRQLRLRR